MGSSTKSRTHCGRGHEYTLENTRVANRPGIGEGVTSRACRQCEKDRYERQWNDPIQKAKLVSRNRAYRADPKNHEKIRALGSKYRAERGDILRPRAAAYSRNRRNALRKAALEAYGHACVWCGESDFFCLQLDHINNDGKAHREKLSSPAELYRWLKDQGYPKNVVQILCGNCHGGKSFYGIEGTPFDPMSCVSAC